jgi:hypothetical protein
VYSEASTALLIRFGNILASCSYDRRVLIWQESGGQWTKVKYRIVWWTV